MYIDIVDSKPLMVYDTNSDPLITNMYLSISIQKGSWWFDLNFGIRKELIVKNSNNNKELVKDVVFEAFQWMIDAGRAQSFNVNVEADINDLSRINLDIVAKKKNGESVKFKTFMSIV